MASGTGAGAPGPGINYLRQEIRGVMVLDGAPNAQSSVSSSPANTVTSRHSAGSAGTPKETLAGHLHLKTSAESTPNSTSSTSNLNNRLSRLPVQLQQNLWKHYRKCSPPRWLPK